MRDPRQLELDFEGKGQEPTMAERHDAAMTRLMRSRVLCYLWGVENGHRKFYDTMPPTTSELLEVKGWLEQDPNNHGQLYRTTLDTILAERAAEQTSILAPLKSTHLDPDNQNFLLEKS